MDRVKNGSFFIKQGRTRQRTIRQYEFIQRSKFFGGQTFLCVGDFIFCKLGAIQFGHGTDKPVIRLDVFGGQFNRSCGVMLNAGIVACIHKGRKQLIYDSDIAGLIMRNCADNPMLVASVFKYMTSVQRYRFLQKLHFMRSMRALNMSLRQGELKKQMSGMSESDILKNAQRGRYYVSKDVMQS